MRHGNMERHIRSGQKHPPVRPEFRRYSAGSAGHSAEQHPRYLLPDRHVLGTRTPVLFRTAIMHASIDGRLTTSLYSHCRYCGRVVSAGNTERAARGSNPREGLTSQQPLPALCPARSTGDANENRDANKMLGLGPAGSVSRFVLCPRIFRIKFRSLNETYLFVSTLLAQSTHGSQFLCRLQGVPLTTRPGGLQ